MNSFEIDKNEWAKQMESATSTTSPKLPFKFKIGDSAILTDQRGIENTVQITKATDRDSENKPLYDVKVIISSPYGIRGLEKEKVEQSQLTPTSGQTYRPHVPTTAAVATSSGALVNRSSSGKKSKRKRRRRMFRRRRSSRRRKSSRNKRGSRGRGGGISSSVVRAPAAVQLTPYVDSSQELKKEVPVPTTLKKEVHVPTTLKKEVPAPERTHTSEPKKEALAPLAPSKRVFVQSISRELFEKMPESCSNGWAGYRKLDGTGALVCLNKPIKLETEKGTIKGGNFEKLGETGRIEFELFDGNEVIVLRTNAYNYDVIIPNSDNPKVITIPKIKLETSSWSAFGRARKNADEFVRLYCRRKNCSKEYALKKYRKALLFV